MVDIEVGLVAMDMGLALVEIGVDLVEMDMVLVDEMMDLGILDLGMAMDPVDVSIDLGSAGSVARQATLEGDVLPMIGPFHVHRPKSNMWMSTRARMFTRVAPAKSAATFVVS